MLIYTANDVKVEPGELSISLRMSKFAKFEAKDRKKDSLSFVCEANTIPSSCFSIPSSSSSLKMKLMGRLLVNHAGGVLENSGLCLHRFFNYPMIPGSALKGIAGHAAWLECEESPDGEEQRKLKEQIIRIFGSYGNDSKSENSGTIAFLAAVPAKESNWKLVTDVQTPHHNCDTQNPTPSFFLAVEKGVTFEFRLRKTLRGTDEDLKLAEKWLRKGLAEGGAGAKTAAGYGYFKEA